MRRLTPRPYQADAIEAGVQFMRSAKPSDGGLIVAPTGSGKSLVIAEIATAMEECIIFQPNAEILKQNAAKIAAYGFAPKVFSASLGSRQVGRFTLATIGSVRSHADRFRGCPNIIIDECHAVNARAGMYRDFLAAMSDARVLGLTATPYRLASNSLGSELRFLTRTRPRVFSRLVHCTQIPDLFRQGFLCPVRYRTVEVLDEAQLEVNSTGADFTDRSVRAHLSEIDFAKRLAGEVQREIDAGRRPVVFTRFIEEAEHLAEQVDEVEVVTQKTPRRERDRILSDYKAGRVRSVANVGIIALGFDFPALDSVVLARPTLSLALYYQQVGRALRPHPDKPVAHVVDMAGLVRRFGRVEDMVLKPGGRTGQQYAFWSRGRQLTNVTMGERRSVAGARW